MISKGKYDVGQQVKIVDGKHAGKFGVITERKGTLYLGWRYRVRTSTGKTYFVLEEYLT